MPCSFSALLAGKYIYQDQALFVAAAGGGGPHAQFKLSKYLLSKEMFSEAYMWMEHAANGGHVAAPVFLGCAYAEGIGVTPDATRALRWWWKAYEQDQNPDVIEFLDDLSEKGLRSPDGFSLAMTRMRETAETLADKAEELELAKAVLQRYAPKPAPTTVLD